MSGIKQLVDTGKHKAQTTKLTCFDFKKRFVILKYN